MDDKNKEHEKEEKEKEPLTREGFFKILDKVIQPKTEEKPPEPEKKETSE